MSAKRNAATKADLQKLVSKVELRTFATSVDGQFTSMDESMRTVGVLLERIDSNVTALAEGLTTTRDELKADMRALEEA